MRLSNIVTLLFLFIILFSFPHKPVAKLNLEDAPQIVEDVAGKNETVRDVNLQPDITNKGTHTSRNHTSEEKDAITVEINIDQPNIYLGEDKQGVNQEKDERSRQKNSITNDREANNSPIKGSEYKKDINIIEFKTSKVSNNKAKQEELKQSDTEESWTPYSKRKSKQQMKKMLLIKAESIITTNGISVFSSAPSFSIKALDSPDSVLLQHHKNSFSLLLKVMKSQWINAPPYEPPKYAF